LKRLAIFAHWDQYNVIENYVVYYLKNLKDITEKIIFVSDCDLPASEIDKIKDYADVSICKKHGEYDFGSYKRGFQYAREKNLLEDVDEVIFANDSCYAPMFPFEIMFKKMDAQTVDYWGASKNYFGIKHGEEHPLETNEPHIQSYFLVFKKDVFTSDCFNNFIDSIKKENDKTDVIINYELGITRTLNNSGFRGSAYSPDYPLIHNSSIVLWDRLIKDGHPFIKTSVLRYKNSEVVFPFLWDCFLKVQTKYPVKYIKDDLKTNQKKIPVSRYGEILKLIRRQVIKIHFSNKRACVKGLWRDFEGNSLGFYERDTK